MNWRDLDRRLTRWQVRLRFEGLRRAFLRDLGSSAAMGIPLTKIIAESAARCEDPLLRRVFTDLRSKIDGGGQLAPTLASWFTKQEGMMIGVFLEGARTNREVGQRLQDAESVIGAMEAMSQARTKTLVTAALVVAACCFALGMTFVGMSHMTKVVSPEKWPDVLVWLFEFGQWMQGAWPVMLAVAVAIPLVARKVLRSWTGATRRALDQRAPLFRAYRDVEGALTMIGLGAFTSAGKGLAEACRQLATQATPWLRSYLTRIERRATDKEGVDIVNVGLLHWSVMVRLAALSASGEFSQALAKVGVESATTMVADVETRMARVRWWLGAVFMPSVFVSCLAVIGWLMATMYSSFSSISRNL